MDASSEQDLLNKNETKIPDYVCCVITEATWTWFAAILFSVILLVLGMISHKKSLITIFGPKLKIKNFI